MASCRRFRLAGSQAYASPLALDRPRRSVGRPAAAPATTIDHRAVDAPGRLGRAGEPGRGFRHQAQPRFALPAIHRHGRLCQLHLDPPDASCCTATRVSRRTHAVNSAKAAKKYLKCPDKLVCCTLRTCTCIFLHLRRSAPRRRRDLPFRHPLLKTYGRPQGVGLFFAADGRRKRVRRSARPMPRRLIRPRRPARGRHPSPGSPSPLRERRWRRRRRSAPGRSWRSASPRAHWSR